MFATYTEARNALDAINARVAAAGDVPRYSPAIDTDTFVAACEAHSAMIRAIYADAKASGFIRLFDGRYRLSPAQAELEG